MNIRVPAPRKLGTPIQLAILTLLAGTQAANAQTQAVQASAAAPASQTQTQTQAQADNASATVPEVLVTATKRATSLQKTPVAITALTAATLEDNHVQNIEDIATLVPGFQATTQGDHGVITMTLRGIGNDQAKPSRPIRKWPSSSTASTRRARKARPPCCSTWKAWKCCAVRKAPCGAATPPSARSICKPPSRSSATVPTALKPAAAATTPWAARARSTFR